MRTLPRPFQIFCAPTPDRCRSLIQAKPLFFIIMEQARSSELLDQPLCRDRRISFRRAPSAKSSRAIFTTRRRTLGNRPGKSPERLIALAAARPPSKSARSTRQSGASGISTKRASATRSPRPSCGASGTRLGSWRLCPPRDPTDSGTMTCATSLADKSPRL